MPLLGPRADRTFLLILAGLLAFYLATRLPALGAKPFHHDESLFATYAYQQLALGNYYHHPLLHGPLQIQLLSGLFWVADGAGLLATRGNAIARLLSVGSGFLLLIVLICGFRKKLGQEGILVASALVCASPALWYYQRFVRNESLFLLTTLALVWTVIQAWRSRRPAGWIVGGFLAAALLVAEKENSLFILFNGVFFLGMRLLHEWHQKHASLHGRRILPTNRVIRNSLRSHLPAWISGVSLAFVVLTLSYTNGFRWEKPFPSFYLEILRYWGGQHGEQRLYGEYHHYLPLLFLYEPFVTIMLLGASLRFAFGRRRIVGRSLLIAWIAIGLWTGSVANSWLSRLLPQSSVDPEKSAGALLDLFHMTHPWHMALAFAVGWLTLWAVWSCLSENRVFRGWLVLWSGFSLLQYGYAGEKVPWLVLHIQLPMILLTAEIFGRWWRGSTAWFGGQQAALALFILFWCLNALQGYRLCFVHPANPGELLVYNHTQPAVHDFAMEARSAIMASNERAKIIVQGEATWPMVWYLRGLSYWTEIGKAGWQDASYLICDVEFAQKHPEIRRYFNTLRVPFRQAFTPAYAPLRLLPIPAADKSADAEPEQSIRKSWATLVRYIITRQPWEPARTADPLDVVIGYRLEEGDSTDR